MQIINFLPSTSQLSGGSNVIVKSGTIGHGQRIPIPAGYKLEECIFIVSPNFLVNGVMKGGPGGYSTLRNSSCHVTNDGWVSVKTYSWPVDDGDENRGGVANYLVIAIKGYNKYKV